MTMSIIRLTTYSTADEVDTAMVFFDELRDALCETYGEEIIDMRRTAMIDAELNDDQTELPFDDDIDFQTRHA